MRVLWASNPPWTSSGYGVQTRHFVAAIQSFGHEVAVHANFGLGGGIVRWRGVTVYPQGNVVGGQDILDAHAAQFAADIAVTLYDAWAFAPERFSQTTRLVPWFPIDTEPMAPILCRAVAPCWDRVVYSQFGLRAVQGAGLDAHYVPHVVDTVAFRPADRVEAREFVSLPQDRFIVGMIAMNSSFPSRKALPQCLQAFAEFRRRHRRDALLYLHTLTARPGNQMHVDIEAVARALGISDAVRLADEYTVTVGASDQHMVALYNSFDILLSPSMGEGFGVPILEAQACGCPVVVGDWTSMGELCFEGFKIPRAEAERTWTQVGSWQFTPRVDAIVEGLRQVERTCPRSTEGITRAREPALAYDVAAVTERYLKPVIDGFSARVRAEAEASPGIAAATRAVIPTQTNRKATTLLGALAQAADGPVVEIGTIRTAEEVPTEGWSTLHLARACATAGRRFSSFDQNPDAVDLANGILRRRGLVPVAAVADGVAAIRSAGPIAMLYLDSSDDPMQTLEQYRAATFVPGAIVVVGDVQEYNGNRLGKATLLAEELGQAGVEYSIVDTVPGFRMLIARLR